MTVTAQQAKSANPDGPKLTMQIKGPWHDPQLVFDPRSLLR